MKIITRFAPSPTGTLHIGGARTALFNYLFAKANNGQFRLRIEDTDKERSSKEFELDILDALQWLGLNHNGEIIYQSKRQNKYQQITEELLKSGNAYKCYCRKEELEAIQIEQRINNQHLSYNGHCRKYLTETTPEEIKQRPFAVRMKIPREGFTTIIDLVQKKVSWQNNTIEDFVIARSDGSATYMLSVVVDDHEMEVTHIIRGDDHLINTPKQIFIYTSMGWEIPKFAHISLIHGPDGSKLSKRHGATSLTSYRDLGFLPEAMNNALLRLGWSHGNEEIIPIDKAIEWFNIEKINKGAARFDIKKLIALNKHYLKNSLDNNLISIIEEKLEQKFGRKLEAIEKERLYYIISQVKTRCGTILEMVDMMTFIENNDNKTDNNFKIDQETKNKIRKIHQYLENSNIEWNELSLKSIIEQIIEELNINMSELSKILRITIIQSNISTNVYDFMICTGKASCLLRLQNYTN